MSANVQVAGGRSVRLAFNPKPTREVAAPAGRIPRVARLMALAIRLDGMLKDGLVGSQAELAAIGHVSRARVTQLLNLLSLAPSIQEEILHFPPVMKGKDPVTERHLRATAAELRWTNQYVAWRTILANPSYDGGR